MPDHIERYAPGPLTEEASAAVTGGRLVEFTGNRTVGPAAANSDRVAGVALRDAAIGQKVAVDHDGTHKLRASGAIAAGQRVVAGAGGVVVGVGVAAADDARRIIGFAREAIADGADGYVTLTLS